MITLSGIFGAGGAAGADSGIGADDNVLEVRFALASSTKPFPLVEVDSRLPGVEAISSSRDVAASSLVYRWIRGEMRRIQF